MEKIDRDQKFARRKIYKKYPFTQHFEILRNCIEIPSMNSSVREP